MPIPREQFDKEGDQTENQILEFLKQHPEEAYECYEVTKGIGYPKLLIAMPDGLGIEGTLNELVKKGLVDTKIIDGKSRYSIHRN